MKKALKHEYDSFYASEQIYRDLDVPWKRGIIFMGVCLLYIPKANGTSLRWIIPAARKRKDDQLESHDEGCGCPDLICQDFSQYVQL